MRYILNLFFCLILFMQCLKVKSSAPKIGPSHGKVVACFWETWSQYRPGRGKFQLEDFDPTLCTHLIVCFMLFDEVTIPLKSIKRWPDINVDENNRTNIMKLKDKYPHLKILVAVGGWQDGSIKYSAMSADPEKRSKFVNATVEFNRKHHFDGLTLFWQYPAKRGGAVSDKENFLDLMKDFRREYDKYGLLMTSVIGATKDIIDNSYNVPEVSLYLDYMFLLSYDYRGTWSEITGPNAPLHGPDLCNVEYVVKYMLELGAQREKLIMGIPLFGRTFVLLEPTNSTLPSSHIGQKFNESYSLSGLYTEDDGFMGYNEICIELLDKNLGWTVYWDESSKTPYAVNEEKLIFFENERSIAEKTKFAMQNGLGGLMVWCIDLDDFRGDCSETIDGPKQYPLLRAIHDEIQLDNLLEHNLIASHLSQNNTSTIKSNWLYFLPLILLSWHIWK